MSDGLHVDTTERIVWCAIEVHRHLGAGLLEAVYEAAICREMLLAGLTFQRQVGVPLYYKGELLSQHRIDLIVDGTVIVEIKSVTRLESIHTAQVLTYLRVTGLRVGLILNFNNVLMKHGIRRFVL
jgi:GxxExxY protein